MTALILWMILAYGTANVVVYGKIFSGVRQSIYDVGNTTLPMSGVFRFISEMIQCIMCFGVWLGFFLGLFVYSPVHEILGVNQYVSWIFDGLLSSGSAWAINAIIEWFEVNRPNNNNQNH
jgi:hypothetical protein